MVDTPSLTSSESICLQNSLVTHGGIQKPPELRRVIDGFRCKSIELLQLHFHIGAFDPGHVEDTGVYRSPQHVKAA